MNLCLGRLIGQILPKGCLASGMFLSIFGAPAGLSTGSMFYKLLNVFFLQKSVHLAILTDSFVHSSHYAGFLTAYSPWFRRSN